MITIKKRFTYRVLLSLTFITPTALLGMRSARVADRYMPTTQNIRRSWCACLCPWRRTSQIPDESHYFCQKIICEYLIRGLDIHNLSMVAEHLTPENVNAKIVVTDKSDISKVDELTILEYVLHRHSLSGTDFKVQLINLLVSLGFDGDILPVLVAAGEIDLIERLIQTPIAYRIQEFSKDTPLYLYNVQHKKVCTRTFAQRIAAAYARSILTPPELKSRFAIIARLLSYPSLKEVIRYQHVVFLKEIYKTYPHILREPIVLAHGNISLSEYTTALFESGYIGSEIFTFLSDHVGHVIPRFTVRTIEPFIVNYQMGCGSQISRRHCTSLSGSGIELSISPPTC